MRCKTPRRHPKYAEVRARALKREKKRLEQVEKIKPFKHWLETQARRVRG